MDRCTHMFMPLGQRCRSSAQQGCKMHAPGGMFSDTPCNCYRAKVLEDELKKAQSTLELLKGRLEKMKRQFVEDSGGDRGFVECYSCGDITIYDGIDDKFLDEEWVYCRDCCETESSTRIYRKFSCRSCFYKDGWSFGGYNDICKDCLLKHTEDQGVEDDVEDDVNEEKIDRLTGRCM